MATDAATKELTMTFSMQSVAQVQYVCAVKIGQRVVSAVVRASSIADAIGQIKRAVPRAIVCSASPRW